MPRAICQAKDMRSAGQNNSQSSSHSWLLALSSKTWLSSSGGTFSSWSKSENTTMGIWSSLTSEGSISLTVTVSCLSPDPAWWKQWSICEFKMNFDWRFYLNAFPLSDLERESWKAAAHQKLKRSVWAPTGKFSPPCQSLIQPLLPGAI